MKFIKKYRKRINIIVVLMVLTLSGRAYYFIQKEIPRFRAVKEGVLYRSGQPRGAGLQYLKLQGIKTLVNLRAPHSDGNAEEKAFAEENGMKFHNLSLGNTKLSYQQCIDEFLDIVNEPENWPVLVHCSRGKERSGFMSAVYLMEKEGWENKAALDETFRLGLTPGRMPLVEDSILEYDSESPLKLKKYKKNYQEVNWLE